MNTTITPGDRLRTDIQCFVLPYGGIGFALDLLVVFGFFILTGERSPWNGEELKHQRLNMYFSFLGLGGGCGVTAYTMIRCNAYSPLVVASVWKGFRVIIFNIISLFCNNYSHRRVNSVTYLIWLEFCYLIISIVGTVALSQIGRASWDDSSMKIGTMQRPLSRAKLTP